jgi:hypothetical protein
MQIGVPPYAQIGFFFNPQFMSVIVCPAVVASIERGAKTPREHRDIEKYDVKRLNKHENCVCVCVCVCGRGRGWYMNFFTAYEVTRSIMFFFFEMKAYPQPLKGSA